MTDIKKVIICIGIWLLIGLLSTIFIWICDMRGMPYDEKYFDNIVIDFMFVIMGALMPVFIIVSFFMYNKRFTKLIYKIANIGVKKENNNDKNVSK